MQGRLAAYVSSLTDKYPAITLGPAEGEAASLDVDYPPSFNRFLNFPILGMIVKVILVIPHLIILFFAAIVAAFAVFFGQFVILFTGRFPPAWAGFVAGTTQLSIRINLWVFAFTDRYPPFSLTPSDPPRDEAETFSLPS
ncbi:MAG: DUF4389 domain-containing protein [Dehalococcoidia bacterium]|nr:DUF4389 domain-containing protein [Dehalococcoidia bacterium]